MADGGGPGGQGGGDGVAGARARRARGGGSLLEFRPATGRTHQVRVHAALLGCPITGDPVYGRAGGPMRLHARQVSVPYDAGAPVTVEAPLPGDWPNRAELEVHEVHGVEPCVGGRTKD